jgi:cytochrome c-type biogenesis protein CcmH/NrfG
MRALVTVVAAAAAIVQLPGIVSTDAIRDSQSAAQSGEYAAALSDARSAVSAEPWSASAAQQEGLVLESTGRLHQAALELRRAIIREPLNYEHWLILSRIETESGHLGAATRDYDRARSLAPMADVFAAASCRTRGGCSVR